MRRSALLACAACLGTALGLACGYSPAEPLALPSGLCDTVEAVAPSVATQSGRGDIILTLVLDAERGCWHEVSP